MCHAYKICIVNAIEWKFFVSVQFLCPRVLLLNHSMMYVIKYATVQAQYVGGSQVTTHAKREAS